MLSQLISKTFANFAQNNKPKSLKQRIKFYSRFPDKYVLRTKIRPPNLKEQGIVFPIKIPIRYRHHFQLKKQLFLSTTEKIHWNRLQPNQILLGFQNVQYLSFKEIVQGLRYLSEIKGQQTHDWNKHQWVSTALSKVKQNVDKIKKTDIMHFYFLMKKLKYSDQEFWKRLYARIEQNIYDLYPKEFEHIYLTYYDTTEQHFSPQAKKKFDKLMQGRLRQFSSSAILQIFQKYIRDKKLDNYWLENVFVSLFKNQQYTYTPQQIARIFRSMMILGHQNNDRLYENLYNRVKKLEYKNLEQANLLEEVLSQVKEIFTSHRVDPVLQLLSTKKIQLKQLAKQEKKKTIQQMVRDDIKYFLQKRKLKQQEKGAQATQ